MGKGRSTTLICGALCLLYAAVSWTAVRGKSATYDEPTHALTGWMMLYHGDYRFSEDVPPLWEKFIALGMGSDAIHLDFNSRAYRILARPNAAPTLTRDLLYRTPGNDSLRLIARGRFLSLLLSCAFLLLLARWAWEIAGRAGAIVAAFCFAVDPNFLGHGALIKNDLPLAMLYLAAAFAVWRAGKRVTLLNACSIIALTGAAFMTKLSGILLGPVILILLTSRALSPEPWSVFGKTLTRKSAKLLTGASLCLCTLAGTWGITWASYSFRYTPGPAGTAIPWQFMAPLPPLPLPGEPAAPLSLSAFDHAVFFAQKYRLLPQAWTSGYWFSTILNQGRDAFAFKQYYKQGRWTYFPLAALVKTPLAILLALTVLVAFIVRRAPSYRRLPTHCRWTVLCLAIPVLVYIPAALNAELNIGLRHVFPLYPFLYLALAWLAAVAWRARDKAHRIFISALAALLTIETAGAYPDYIAYFNFLAGGPTGGVTLLSDSNLDWGQDLPQIADWHRQHADVPLELRYFGSVDPAYYGLPTDPISIHTPHILAISAMQLQYLWRDDPPLQRRLQTLEPQAVLGGTIYLYSLTDH